MDAEPDEEMVQEFRRTFGFAMKEIQGSSAWSMDRNRPYDGQPHTDDGERGKTIVAGLTMRDVQDCFVMGFLHASEFQRAEKGISERKNPVRDDLYSIDLEQIDPVAAIQCAMVEIEKMMGIFPNVPKLTYKSQPPDSQKDGD